MLKRINILGYKSFKELDLELMPITVIMGPNAAGKSNLLDAIYLISRLATARNIKESFDGHRGLPIESFFYGEKGFEELLKEEKGVSCTFEIDVELSESTINEINLIVYEKRKGLNAGEEKKKVIKEKFLRYTLTLQLLPKTGHLRVMNEQLVALRKDERGPKESRKPFLEKVEEKGFEKIHLRMEGQAHPTYHPIGMEHTIVSTSLYEPHYPHIVAFRKELEKWRTYYLEPKTLMREDVPISETLGIGPKGENLAAFLNTLQNRNKRAFESLNLALQQILPTKSRVDLELLKEGRVGLRISENGLIFSARLISEGTLRLIGLLAAVHPENPSVLIGYEEPENGVHPVRLKIVSDLLKNAVHSYGKQIIITTHSPIFAELVGDENLLVCSMKKKTSVIKPFKTFGPLYRRVDIEHALRDRILRGDLGG